MKGQPPQPVSDSALRADEGHEDRPQNRLLRKKFLTPVVLAVIGVALGLTGYALYPSRTQLPTPTYSTLHLYSNIPINTITYQAFQKSSSVAEIKISVLLSNGAAIPPSASLKAGVIMYPPVGIPFRPCTKPFCQIEPDKNYRWVQPLTFRRAVGPGDLPHVTGVGINAFVKIFVKAPDFGVTSDGATASAAIPKLLYTGPGTVNLVTQYDIPSASHYDWSTLPPAFAAGGEAQWLEQMNSNNVIPDANAAGTDHVTQARDSDLTFLAGILIGLAGGALLSAIQEVLHASD